MVSDSIVPIQVAGSETPEVVRTVVAYCLVEATRSSVAAWEGDNGGDEERTTSVDGALIESDALRRE